jgi:hypothetical protein
MGLAAESPHRSKSVRLGPSYVTNREQFAGMPRLASGDRLSLRRRPDRQFDPGSVEVLTTETGEAIGFLPPASSGMLASLMDEGGSAFAIVHDAIQPDGPLLVEVYLALPA